MKLPAVRKEKKEKESNQSELRLDNNLLQNSYWETELTFARVSTAVMVYLAEMTGRTSWRRR